MLGEGVDVLLVVEEEIETEELLGADNGLVGTDEELVDTDEDLVDEDEDVLEEDELLDTVEDFVREFDVEDEAPVEDEFDEIAIDELRELDESVELDELDKLDELDELGELGELGHEAVEPRLPEDVFEIEEDVVIEMLEDDVTLANGDADVVTTKELDLATVTTSDELETIDDDAEL